MAGKRERPHKEATEEQRQMKAVAEFQERQRKVSGGDTIVAAPAEKPWLQSGSIESPVFQPPIPSSGSEPEPDRTAGKPDENAEKTPDAKTNKEDVKKDYIRLGKKLTQMGIDVGDVAAWASATEAFEAVIRLEKKFEKERKPERKEIIKTSIQKLATSLRGRIASEVMRSAQEMREEGEGRLPGRFTMKEEKTILGEMAKRVSEAAALEAAEQKAIDERIAASHGQPQASDIEANAAVGNKQDVIAGEGGRVDDALTQFYPGVGVPVDVYNEYETLKKTGGAEFDAFMERQRDLAAARLLPDADTIAGVADNTGTSNGEKTSSDEKSTDPRLQANLIRAILAAAGGDDTPILDILSNKEYVEVSDKQKREAMEIMRDPESKEAVGNFLIGSMGPDTDAYVRAFEALGTDSEKPSAGKPVDSDQAEPAAAAEPVSEPTSAEDHSTKKTDDMRDVPATASDVQGDHIQAVQNDGEKLAVPTADDRQWEDLAALLKSQGSKPPTERTQEEQMAALFKKLTDEEKRDGHESAESEQEWIDRMHREEASRKAVEPEPASEQEKAWLQEVALSGTDNDRTPSERKQWAESAREKLRSLINGATEKAAVGERAERLANYCSARSKALQESAKAYGANPEKIIRDVGEKYNKLSFLKKLGIGFSLGVGAAAFSTVSTPIALVFGGLLGAQRFAGGASMYLKMEEHLLQAAEGTSKNFLGRREWYRNLFMGTSERQRKVLAGVMAATWTLGSGLAVKELVQLGSETQFAESVQNYLKQFFHGATPAVSESPTLAAEVPGSPGPGGISTGNPAVPQNIDARLHADAGAQAGMSNMPTVSASSHGYEGMLKDLVKHLPETKPQGIADGSDLAKLYAAKGSADPEELGKAIHRIAMNHKFFTDQGSFRVDIDAHMTVDNNGAILFNGETDAPASAHYNPDAHKLPVAPASEGTPQTTPIDSAPASPNPEVVPAAPSDISKPPAEAVPVPENLAHTQEITAGVIAASIAANSYGVKVSPAESHIYMDESKLFVHGGSPDERKKQAAEYLKVHPSDVIYDVDESGRLIPLGLVDGNLTAGEPVLASGPMDRVLGFFSGPKLAPPPDPAQFRRLIK
jgi:hypothetical protein